MISGLMIDECGQQSGNPKIINPKIQSRPGCLKTGGPAFFIESYTLQGFDVQGISFGPRNAILYKMNPCSSPGVMYEKHAVFFAIILTSLCIHATLCQAQQPSATVRVLGGKVLLIIPQQEAVRVKEGDILGPGDMIELKPGASATLALSDGSEIQLGENTKLDIAMLMETPQKARKSGLKLFYGRLRAFLSGDHQKEGSSFEVETPNAQVGVKFSQPGVLVSYDHELETSYINAYTVGSKVKNTITGAEVDDIPKGHQAIVKDKYIQVIKLTDATREIDEWGKEEIGTEEETGEGEAEEEQVAMNALLGTCSPAMASISGCPGADFPSTSRNPPPGKLPVRPDSRVEPVDFTLIIDNE